MNAVVAPNAAEISTVLRTTIGAICDQFEGEVQTGPFGSQLHASDYSAEGIPVVMPQDMVEGKISCNNIARVSATHAHRLSQHRIRAGDIVFSRRGDVGRFAVVTPLEEGWLCGTGSIRIRLNCPDIDTGYLRHFLKQDTIGNWLLHNAKGVTMPNLNTSIIRAIPFAYPSLNEQRRIATILDNADTLRRKRKRGLDLLDGLTQSIFLEMFGDPVSNPRNFPITSFGQIGTLDRGVSKHRPRNDPVLLGGPHPLIQTGDVANSGGYIRSYTSTYSEEGLRQSKKWPAGTLCITIAANIAQTGILTFPACFPDSVVGFQHEQPAMSQFVRVWLMFLRATLERTAPAVAQKNINLQILRDMKIALPPFDMVSLFANRLSGQLRTEKQMQIGSTETQALFASLQYRAFSGQL